MFSDEAWDRGCRRIRCVTSPINESSIAFHTKMGFEIERVDGEPDGVPIRTDYDGYGEDKVVFVKSLFE